jgi:hypothetical protein
MSDPRTKHEIKTCPRCGRAFECKVNNPAHCDCAQVQLTEETVLALEGRYQDCLCLTCLTALAAGESMNLNPAIAHAKAPSSPRNTRG